MFVDDPVLRSLAAQLSLLSDQERAFTATVQRHAMAQPMCGRPSPELFYRHVANRAPRKPTTTQKRHRGARRLRARKGHAHA